MPVSITAIIVLAEPVVRSHAWEAREPGCAFIPQESALVKSVSLGVVSNRPSAWSGSTYATDGSRAIAEAEARLASTITVEESAERP
jgi:hypothetical protein